MGTVERTAGQGGVRGVGGQRSDDETAVLLELMRAYKSAVAVLVGMPTSHPDYSRHRQAEQALSVRIRAWRAKDPIDIGD